MFESPTVRYVERLELPALKYSSVGRYHRLCATVSTVKKYRGTR